MTEIHHVHARTLNEDKVKTLDENHGHTLWKLTGRWYEIKKKNKDLFCYKVYEKKNLKIVDALFCTETLNLTKK